MDPDPVRRKYWDCTAEATDACRLVWDSYTPKEYDYETLKNFCGLPESDRSWTRPALSTIASFDWVCDKTWMVTTARSLFFLGFGLGALLWGRVADSVGRKPTAFVGLLLQAGVAAGLAFVRRPYLHLGLRLLLGKYLSRLHIGWCNAWHRRNLQSFVGQCLAASQAFL